MPILDAYGRQLADTPRPALTRELGSGGVSVIAGVLDDEEHVNALRGLDGVKIFDRMRRTDGEVAAVLNALQLPILAADPVIDVPEDEELAGRITDEHLDFARRNAFDLNDFQTVMRHVLSSMWAGYAWFEKTYSARDGRLWLDRLAPRLATTLWRWQVDEEGELTGIIQRVRKGTVVRDVPIPRDKLALFTFGKEANDWGGISALRAAYRNWLICDAVYKLDAIRIERYAVGVPVFKLTGEYTDDQVALLKEMGENWRGAEQSYVILVGDVDFSLASMPSAQTLDVMPTIRHHNEQIAKSVLAQFINLGTTESGSRALGESMMEFFYDAVEGHAKSYATQFNREVLWPLMDLNFPGNPRPELRLENIGSVALPMLADGLAKLQSYVNWDEDTEEFVRKRFGLPPRTATSPPPKPTAPVMVGPPAITLPPVGAPKGSGTQVQSLVFSKERFTESQAKKWAADHDFRSSAVDETESSWRLRQFDPEHCRTGSFGQRELDDGVQAVFCDVGERAGNEPATVLLTKSGDFWRPLTDVEKHVRLRQIDARLDDGRDAIVSALLDLREEIAEDLVGEIRRAWKDGPAGFAEVSVPERTVERAAKAVVPELEELYDFGRQEVRRELGRQSKAKGRKLASKPGNVRTSTILRRQAIALRDEGLTPDEIGELMAYRAGKLATRLSAKTMEAALSIAAGRWRTQGGNEPTGQALDDIMEAVFSSVEREAKLVANMSASEALNLGRDFEAQRLKEQIDVAIYSSVLDDNTCFVAGTKVLTASGWKPIDEVHRGELVQTHRGRWMGVIDLHSKLYNGPLIGIDASRSTITATAEHPFLTPLGWVPASALASGEQVIRLADSLVEDVEHVDSDVSIEDVGGEADDAQSRGFDLDVLPGVSHPGFAVPIGTVYFKGDSEVRQEEVCDPSADLVLADVLDFKRFQAHASHHFRPGLPAKPPVALEGAEPPGICLGRDNAESRSALLADGGMYGAPAKLRAVPPPPVPLLSAHWLAASSTVQMNRFSPGAAQRAEVVPLGVAARHPEDLAAARASFLNAFGFEPAGTGASRPASARRGTIHAEGLPANEAVFLLRRQGRLAQPHVPVGSAMLPVTGLGAKLAGRPIAIGNVYSAAVDTGGFHASNIMNITEYCARGIQVYNLEVEEDHSYVAEGFVVHNCDPCRQADGEETKVGSDEYYDLTPPLNSSRFGACAGMNSCRCIWTYLRLD